MTVFEVALALAILLLLYVAIGLAVDRREK